MSWSYSKFSSNKCDWQKNKTGWEVHSVTPTKANSLVDGYLLLLKRLGLGFILNQERVKNSTALDIGSGAGYIGHALFKADFSVLCTEHTKQGVTFLKGQNPELNVELFDISNRKSIIDQKFDLIICRELYPFTRVNCFESQLESLENILSYLNKEGVLLLIGSTISFPHCANYKLLLKTLNNSDEYEYLHKYAEMFISRRIFMLFGLPFVRNLSRLLPSIIKFIVNPIMRKKYTDIMIYVIKNKSINAC